MSGWILTIALLLTMIVGCERGTPQYKLPAAKPLPKAGIVGYISPAALLDSLNQGRQLRLTYLEENPDTVKMLPIPGLRRSRIGEFYMVADTMSRAQPIYLMCLWGDDSRKAAIRLSASGFDCYSVDGGIYRLKQYITELTNQDAKKQK